MSMIFALNGALPSAFGNLGAATQEVAALQTALVAMGKAIGDTVLAVIKVDGVIGPATTAATNRAFVKHIGPGQADAQWRTGTLPQATVAANAGTLALLVAKEVQRRGFSVGPIKIIKPAAPAPAITPKVATTPAYTAPAAAPAATYAPAYTQPVVASTSGKVYQVPSDDTAKLALYGALGLGAVALLGAAVYFVRRRQDASAPAVAGFGTVTWRGDKRVFNDDERELWVGNDEGLYNWYKESARRHGGGVRAFVRRNRAEIDEAINRVLDRKPLRGTLGAVAGFGAAKASRLTTSQINIMDELRAAAKPLTAGGWNKKSVAALERMGLIRTYYKTFGENRILLAELVSRRADNLGAGGATDDHERRLWILNHKPLYDWWKRENVDIYTFIARHRQEITRRIAQAFKQPKWRAVAGADLGAAERPKLKRKIMVHGMSCTIRKVHKFGTLDAECPNGKWYRVTGLDFI